MVSHLDNTIALRDVETKVVRLGQPKANQDKLLGDSFRFEAHPRRLNPDLTDEELLITSPVLKGFSFSDKLWCEYLYALFSHVMDR